MALGVVDRRRAIKDLRNLPHDERKRAVARVAAYAAEPGATHNDVVHLVGTPHFRVRVGDWHVVFEVEDGRLEVVRVGHRREVYR